MGVRGELYSTSASARNGRETYFFNFKENREGDIYLNIVESRKKESAGDVFQRRSVIVFEENLTLFLAYLFEGLEALIEGRDYTKLCGDDRRKYSIEVRKQNYDYALMIREEVEGNDRFESEALWVRAPGTVFSKSLVEVKAFFAGIKVAAERQKRASTPPPAKPKVRVVVKRSGQNDQE